MGLFNLFKKESNTTKSTSDNGILGPTFFDNLTEPISDPKDLQSHEWRRQLKTPSGQTRFKIKYYGQLHEEHPNLIVQTDFAPALVFAVDSSTGQEILLFDGCKHGYNALFCNTFTKEQIENRPTNNFYRYIDGNDTFEIILSTYNSIDYDDEFADQVDENGLIELIDGSKIVFEKAKRNGYDTLQIWGKTQDGNTIKIVSEELA
jgi:hypothetical protein